MEDKTATYLRTTPAGVSVSAIEYGHEGRQLVLLRVSAGPGYMAACGVDLSPESALELSAALKKHAQALMTKEPAPC